MMKRDKFLGQDPTEKIVFVFFFERNRITKYYEIMEEFFNYKNLYVFEK